MKNTTKTKSPKKSTSSHSLKIASKTAKKITAKISDECMKSYYSPKTLEKVYAVGNSFLDAHKRFEKRTASQKVELVRLSGHMIIEAKKNRLALDRYTLRSALYHFIGYKSSDDNKAFMMSIKRVIDATFYLFENKNTSITDEGQILDSKGKVVPVKELDKKSSSKPTRNRETKKNQVSTLTELVEALAVIKTHKNLIKDVPQEMVSKTIELLQENMVEAIIEAKEEPNKQMKTIGDAKMPNFSNSRATA